MGAPAQTTPEQIIEKLEQGDLNFIEDVLIKDIDGIKVATDKLEGQREVARNLMDSFTSSSLVGSCSGLSVDFLRIADEFESFDPTKTFIGRWKKPEDVSFKRHVTVATGMKPRLHVGQSEWISTILTLYN